MMLLCHGIGGIHDQALDRSTVHLVENHNHSGQTYVTLSLARLVLVGLWYLNTGSLLPSEVARMKENFVNCFFC
jgi:hypothetical protein